MSEKAGMPQTAWLIQRCVLSAQLKVHILRYFCLSQDFYNCVLPYSGFDALTHNMAVHGIYSDC